MIQESFSGPRFLAQALGFRAEYKIPDVLNHNLPLSVDGFVNIHGPKDNLDVVIVTCKADVPINELAPQGTRFIVSDIREDGRVYTHAHKKEVMLPANQNKRDALVTAVLFAMERVRIHEDSAWHEKSERAHDLLKFRLAHLQAFGRIELPDDKMERRKELEAWEIVCKEERLTTKNALTMLESIYQKSIDPIPHIRTPGQLVKLVNGVDVLRTYHQMVIHPRHTGEEINIPMSLPESQIATYFHK